MATTVGEDVREAVGEVVRGEDAGQLRSLMSE